MKLKPYLLLLFICTSIYSQTYELTYEIVELKEFEMSKNFNEQERRIMERYLQDIKDYANNFKLNILATRNSYYYKIEDMMPIGSMSQEYKQVTTISRIGLFQNLLFNGESVYFYNNTDKFVTRSNLNLLKWNLTGKKKIINNYNCYEIDPVNLTDYNLGYNAVNLKAWFTNDVFIKAGPTPYANFPGLIIVLENQFVKYKLKKIKIVEKEIPDLSNFIAGYKVFSYEDAQKYHKKVGEMIINDK